MRVASVIAEFNPFHNGHEYHVTQSRRALGADYVVIILSGQFVQRGEPAMFDKYARTKAALLCGADLVLELPIYYATASAKGFARGAISTLSASGIVDFISFGSESGDLSLLKKAANFMASEPPEFSAHLRKYMSSGYSFAKARSLALESISPELAHTLAGSNNILAVEYLLAMREYPMAAFTIKRYWDDNSKSLDVPFPSATAIRSAIRESRPEAAESLVPADAKFLLNEPVMGWENFSDLLLFRLLDMDTEDLSGIMDMDAGLCARFIKALHSGTVEDLIFEVKSKDHTLTRIQRAMLHVLLSMKQREYDALIRRPLPPYIRVLGFDRNAEPLLKQLAKKSRVPVIMNLKNAPALDSQGQSLLEKELFASDMYYLARGDLTGRRSEFSKPLVIVE